MPASFFRVVPFPEDVVEQVAVCLPEEPGEFFLEPSVEAGPVVRIVVHAVEKEAADEDLAARVGCAFLLRDACPDGFLPRLDGGPILR